MNTNAAELVLEAIERVGAGITVGTVTVTYDAPYWAGAQVWVHGECSVCHATSVMRTSGEATSLQYLASIIANYECPKREHNG